jgi:photosystem II stability/assembly factor-like uncharacterized protein
MSEESGFFTSVAGDRKYTASFMNEKLHEAMQRAEGVVKGADGELAVTTDGSLSVDVAAGVAFKGGVFYRTPASLHLPLALPSLGTQRSDRVVVRIDRYARTMRAVVVQGNEGSDPVSPEYNAEDDVPLAAVLVNRLADPPVVTVADERHMRPLFLTDRHSIDDLAEGTLYGRVLKAKAEALNAGQTGLSFRHFVFTARPWTAAQIECALMPQGGSTIVVGRSNAVKLSYSTNSGITWSDAAGIDVDNKIMSLAYTGSAYLAAGGSPARIYRGVSMGSWSKVFEDATQEFVSALVALSPLQIVAACGDKVYASSNGGTSWSLRGSLPDNYLISAMASLGNGVLLAAGYATDKLWRSTDSGATWSAVKTTDCYEKRPAFIQHIGNGLVLAGYNDGGLLYRSTDYGLTWDAGRRIVEGSMLTSILVDGDALFLPQGKSLYESKDGGSSWSMKYPCANYDGIVGIGKDSDGNFITLGYQGHLYWGYPVAA